MKGIFENQAFFMVPPSGFEPETLSLPMIRNYRAVLWRQWFVFYGSFGNVKNFPKCKKPRKYNSQAAEFLQSGKGLRV